MRISSPVAEQDQKIHYYAYETVQNHLFLLEMIEIMQNSGRKCTGVWNGSTFCATKHGNFIPQ